MNVSDITTNSAVIKVDVNDIDKILENTKSKVHLYAFYPRIFNADYSSKSISDNHPYASKIGGQAGIEFQSNTNYPSHLINARKALIENELLIKKVELQKGLNTIILENLKSTYPICIYITESYKMASFNFEKDKDIIYKIPVSTLFETRSLFDVRPFDENKITNHPNEETPMLSTADATLDLTLNVKAKVKNITFKMYRFLFNNYNYMNKDDPRKGNFYEDDFEEKNFTINISPDETEVSLDMKRVLRYETGQSPIRTFVILNVEAGLELLEDIQSLDFGKEPISKETPYTHNFDIAFKW